MKRFFSFLLAWFLITLLTVVISVGVWFLLTGDSSDFNYAPVNAQVVSTGQTKPFVTKENRFFGGSRYRLVYTQFIAFKYTYENKIYNTSGEYNLSTEYYDTKPVPIAYPSPYYEGKLVKINVLKSNPETITLDQDSGPKDVKPMDIAKVAVPIYAVLMLLVIISYIRKGRQIRKENFYKKMGMGDF